MSSPRLLVSRDHGRPAGFCFLKMSTFVLRKSRAFRPMASARASGNYMVRNTPFSRDFLMRWAKYYDRRPKGFSSADNGAIQLVAPGLNGYTT